MTTLPNRVWPHPVLLWAVILCSLVFLLGNLGCARHVLRPVDLPAEYQAPPCQDLSAVNFSRLVQYSVSSQRIDRGDVLEVSLITDYKDDEPTVAPVRIAEDGEADIPLVGKIALSGLELDEAEKAIATAGVTRGIFRNPHVTVTMKQQRTNRVTVVGAVQTPGVYELPRSSSTLLAALVAAGNLSEDASPEVEIRQSGPAPGNPGLVPPDQPRVAGPMPGQLTSFQTASARPLQTVRINLISATQEANSGYSLNDGDVVMVAKQPPRSVHVLGLVKTPGQYEIPANEEMRVLDAIATAGGLSTRLADNVLVLRRVPDGQEPIQIKISLREAKQDGAHNLRLAAGDTVSIEETPVTLVWDTLTTMIRFGFSGAVPLF